jgi:hypothetical protein
MGIIKPISGDVSIVSYEVLGKGHTQTYRVLVKR